MRFVFLSISLSLFFLPEAFSQSKPVKPAGAAGTITLTKEQFDLLNNQVTALAALNKSLKSDSIRFTKSYGDLKKRYRSDSAANAIRGKSTDTALIGKRARNAKLKEETTALDKELSFDEAEIKRIDRDSAAFTEKLRSSHDSIAAKSSRIKQAGDFAKNGTALEKRLAASLASEKSLKDQEAEQAKSFSDLTARFNHLQDSLARLNKTTAELSKVRSDNTRLKEQIFGNFKKATTTLATGTDFSEQRAADLKAQSQRLSPFFAGNPDFAACNDKITQFETLSASIHKAGETLERPFDPASCKAAVELLGKTSPLTAEQTARVAKYKSVLANYCAISHNSDSIAAVASVFTSSDHTLANKLLTGQMAKVDKRDYPFLYGELERLNENATKGLPIKDNKIGHATCH